MADRARVLVQDHIFVIGDGPDPMPIEMIDYGTGLAGVMPSAAFVHTGINSGTVTVTATPLDEQPDLEKPHLWDEIVEISLHAPAGQLSIHRLSYGPFDTPPDLPLMSPHGPGHYRIRIHARGRDRHHDKDVNDSTEEYHLISWPAEPLPQLIIRATDRAGYGMRLSALTRPISTEPDFMTPEEQAAAARAAVLRQAAPDN